MLFATMGQGTLWIWMMAAGAAMYMLYLLLRALRGVTQAGFALTLIADLAFGCGCAALFMLFLYAGNYGRVRFFEIPACALGALVCALAVNPPLKRAGKCLRRLAKRIWTAASENRLIKIIFR